MSKYAFELKWFPIPDGVPNLSEDLFDLIGEREPPPPRSWAIQDLVPNGEVVLIAGTGGTGKSTLALQMAAHLALGRPFLGRKTRKMPAYVISLEDGVDEIKRRFWAIAKALGVHPSSLDLIGGIGRGDYDPTLFGPNTNGYLEMTRTFQFIESGLEYFVRCSEPRTPSYGDDPRGQGGVVFIDNISVAFAGNENSRPEVRAFITALYAFARRHDVTIVLLGHVSKSGLASGDGYSGSTDWHNAVRLRLFLSKPPASDGGGPTDKHVRELSIAKSNFGPDGLSWSLTLRDGYFWEDETQAGGDKDSAINAALLDTIRVHEATGRRLSPSKNAANYAPKAAHREKGRRGERLRDFEAAFERLLAAGSIRVVEDGPASRRRQTVRTTDAPDL